MKFNDKKDKGYPVDFIVTSIGACVAMPDEKKKDPCVMVAYATGEGREISHLMIDFLPKGRLHSRETILSAIMAAEKVKNITYTDAMGGPKDIYFCRPGSGKITDVVERNYDTNHYKGDIAEIYSSPLRFIIGNHSELVFKSGKVMNMKISGTTESQYAEGSYEYAAVNAFNACLLGRLFECEELRLQTKDKRRVKLAVRMEKTEYMEEDVLCIKPVLCNDGATLDYYLTEEFNFIDGATSSCRAYKINYSNRFNDYNLVRA